MQACAGKPSTHCLIALLLCSALVALLGTADHSTAADPSSISSVSSSSSSSSSPSPRSFSISSDQFIKDGRPFRIIAGEVHYFRIPVQYWQDRLQRLAALGLNAVQVYVPWNWHEQVPGQFDLEGWRDLPAFIRLAQELGLLVLLRPGPYICAEWDFGGLPAWLLSNAARDNATAAVTAAAASEADAQAVQAAIQQAVQEVAAVSASTGCSRDALLVRSSDPRYLHYVDRWWDVLLPRLAPLMYDRGGPVVMVQVENEYGYYNRSDPSYLRHLVAKARQHLGPHVLLYTTDLAREEVLERGTLPGSEVLTVVDFGSEMDVAKAFGLQARYNAPGQSPPLCSEYYIGWMTHWGERMAYRRTHDMVSTLQRILAYGNGTGSVVLYMAHGGTNFGLWAGANVFETYQPHITSYDYHCPVGEAGTTGQLGLGGLHKYNAIRALIGVATGKRVHQHTHLPHSTLSSLPGMAQAAAVSWSSQDKRDGGSPGAVPAAGATMPAASAVTRHLSTATAAATTRGTPEPLLAAYGVVRMTHRADLLRNLDSLGSEAGVVRDERWPRHMEQYGQSFGLILYSTQLQAAGGGAAGGTTWHQPDQLQASQQAAAVTGGQFGPVKQPHQELNFTAHDYAKVLLGSQVVGSYWRNTPAPVLLPDPTSPGMEQHDQRSSQQAAGGPTSLHLLVEAMGRNNFALDHTKFLDLKGLVVNVTLDGVPLANWTVQPIELGSADLANLQWSQLTGGTQSGSRHYGKLAAGRQCADASDGFRPSFYKGSILVPGTAPAQDGSSSQQGEAGSAHPADTFIHMGGWDKGVVWVNGHCLGRYWQSQGPQYSLYCPGAWLRPGADNEVVVLELSRVPEVAEVKLVDAPDFGASWKAWMWYGALALLLAVAGLALTKAAQHARRHDSANSACTLVCNGDRGKPSPSRQGASAADLARQALLHRLS